MEQHFDGDQVDTPELGYNIHRVPRALNVLSCEVSAAIKTTLPTTFGIADTVRRCSNIIVKQNVFFRFYQ
jgi:hypothetical protein